MKKAHYIFAFLLLNLNMVGQVLFTAEASRYKVGVGETFTITFKINADAGNFNYPDFVGFQVVSGPMTGMSTTIINGKMSQERTAAFDLIALETGTFTIGEASAKAGGETYKTKPLKIEVIKERKKQAGSLEEKAAELASIKILTNKRSVYVGEPIAARYTLVLKTNVGNFDFLEEPQFQGFIKNDIEIKRIETKEEVINGERVTTADLSKFVLIPQRSGELSPGTLRMRIPTAVPTGRRDWFGNQETRTVNQISSSTFPTVNVKPLPTAGKPASFSGGVGKYRFYVSLSRNEVKADESITLTVEVDGSGNLQLLELPKPKLPNSIESYEPKFKENISVRTSGISGNKRNEYLLVPRYKGVYKIPPIQFSYFDPDTEEYVELTSEELEINVTEGPQANVTPGNASVVTPDKSNVTALGEDILFIHTTPSDFELPSKSLFERAIHWILLLIFLFALIVAIIYLRFKQSYNPDLVAKAKKKAATEAERAVKKAKTHITNNNTEAFYAAITAALQSYFYQKYRLAKADFSVESASDVIKKKGAGEDLQAQLKYLSTQADSARFAPKTQTNMSNDLEKALSLINNLEQL